MSRLLLFVTAFAAVVAQGTVHGLWTERWTPSAESAAVIPAERVPLTVGDWDGTTVEQDPNEIPTGVESGNFLLRRYVNRISGAAVTMVLQAGRPGPMVASHTPDSCYVGAGYSFVVPMARRPVSVEGHATPDQFYVGTLSKTERAMPMHLRLFWSWTATGTWDVPDRPRLAFAKYRRLYKLYVIRQMLRDSEPMDNEPAAAFLQVLVPELQKSLFPGS
jgi:hypothetical protein